MRQKADKLEKGEWYAETSSSFSTEPTFFRFESANRSNSEYIFDMVKGEDSYPYDPDGKQRWWDYSQWYLPTPEDIEKYNLNEE